MGNPADEVRILRAAMDQCCAEHEVEAKALAAQGEELRQELTAALAKVVEQVRQIEALKASQDALEKGWADKLAAEIEAHERTRKELGATLARSSEVAQAMRGMLEWLGEHSSLQSIRERLTAILRGEKAMPPAGALHTACVLVRDHRGRVLVVERKDKPGMWGLPGGKVEPREEPRDGALRELEEETGLFFREYDVSHLHSGAFDGATCHAYEASNRVDPSEVERQTGEGRLKWVEPVDLYNPAICPFVEFYREALVEVFGIPDGLATGPRDDLGGEVGS